MLATGRPTKTCAPPRSTTEYVEYVVSSVGPYRLPTLSTPAAYSARARSAGRGSPPRFSVRTEAGIAPVRSSSAAAVGTMLA